MRELVPGDSGAAVIAFGQLERLLDRTRLMVRRWRPDGTCAYVNKAWATFRGRAAEQELGDGWLEGLHPEDAEATQASLRQHLAQAGEFELRYRLRRHDGEYCWVVDAGLPYCGIDGALQGVLGTAAIESPSLTAPARPGAAPLPMLSPREREVLMLIAAGMDNLKIAAHLAITERTVKAHVTALYRKLQQENRTQLALWAIQRGLTGVGGDA